MIPLGVLASARRAASGVTVSDDFNRADGAIGSAWSIVTGGFNIASNVAVQTTSNSQAYYGTSLGSDDVYAEATLSTTAQLIYARSPGAGAVAPGYVAYYSGTAWTIARRGSSTGTFTTVASLTEAASAPYLVRLEVEGAQQRLYAAGVLKVTGADATITTGQYAGIRSNGGGSINDFEAGSL